MFQRTGIIEEIQAESSNRAGFENIIYIRLTEEWSPAPCPCPKTYSYFNAKENPHFTAILLAAKLNQKPVRIWVDDTYPILNSFCQIINIDIK